MAVDTHNLQPMVLQAIESWTSTQNHALGRETVDLSTGKRYMYKYLAAAVTSTGVCSSGTPVGNYIADANATHTAHHISADQSLAQGVPIGVVRGSATSTNCYGWVEMADPSLPTTVNGSWVAVLAGALMYWGDDGFLETIDGAAAGTTAAAASICAFAVDSHRTSYSRDSVLLTTAVSVTPVYVQWR